MQRHLEFQLIGEKSKGVSEVCSTWKLMQSLLQMIFAVEASSVWTGVHGLHILSHDDK